MSLEQVLVERYSKDDTRKEQESYMHDERWTWGKIRIVLVALRPKIYVYINLDKKLEDKAWKGTKMCVVTKILAFDG